MDIEEESICGIWMGPEGRVYLSLKDVDNSRREISLPFMPYAWAHENAIPADCDAVKLDGEGPLNRLIRFPDVGSYQQFLDVHKKLGDIENINSLENQYLLEHKQRMFRGMNFDELRRCQCDIETGCGVPGSFSNAHRTEDRVLAIGLKMGKISEYLVLEEFTAEGERALFERFNATLQELDPDVIEGHNIFKFDLEYLRVRYQKLGVPRAWGRFGQEATFRHSKLKIAERWVDFPRYEIPGRTVFDTYLMIQIYDVTKRELASYGLKSLAVTLGLTNPDSDERTYLAGNKIHDTFNENRHAFLAYLEDDLRETKGVADLLLPTYFAQVQSFPMTLQEAGLRGTSNKVELLFLEKYFHARESLPEPTGVSAFAGGFTKSYEFGVFKHVLHFDVASLYPSLLMFIGRNPKTDSLGCFMPILKELREYRLEYKKKAREAADENLKREYEARQTSYKILINSFYGYLGFPGARFADGDLAATVTLMGRELLQALINKFQELGCTVLEADTDGIYLSSPEYFEQPLILLKAVSTVMPEGVELEFDGSYESMFSYKAKNYALFDGESVIIRGSALRSRGMEPFLKELTDRLIHYLLGASTKDPNVLISEIRSAIVERKMGVEQLAKSERLSQKPEIYVKMVEGGRTPRRASLEVALKMKPVPKMGDKVTYFITKGEKKRLPDWQQAKSVDDYDPELLPYDGDYYLKKLDDWLKRHGEFLPGYKESQQELF